MQNKRLLPRDYQLCLLLCDCSSRLHCINRQTAIGSARHKLTCNSKCHKAQTHCEMRKEKKGRTCSFYFLRTEKEPPSLQRHIRPHEEGKG